MPIERYCVLAGCAGGGGCTNKYRRDEKTCPYEYVAADSPPEFRWLGDDPPPRRWKVGNNTVVYRSFADYCD